MQNLEKFPSKSLGATVTELNCSSEAEIAGAGQSASLAPPFLLKHRKWLLARILRAGPLDQGALDAASGRSTEGAALALRPLPLSIHGLGLRPKKSKEPIFGPHVPLEFPTEWLLETPRCERPREPHAGRLLPSSLPSFLVCAIPAGSRCFRTSVVAGNHAGFGPVEHEISGDQTFVEPSFSHCQRGQPIEQGGRVIGQFLQDTFAGYPHSQFCTCGNVSKPVLPDLNLCSLKLSRFEYICYLDDVCVTHFAVNKI